MKYYFYIVSFLFSALLLTSCEKEYDTAKRDKEIEENKNGDNQDSYIKGVVSVRLSREIADKFESTSSNILTKSGNDALDAYMKEIGATKMTRVFSYDKRYEKRDRREGLHQWYYIEFDESKPTTKVAEDLNGINGIEYAEKVCKIIAPSYEYVPMEYTAPLSKASENLPFDDKELSKQWHYHNTQQVPNSIAGADINLFEAWEIETGDSDVIVAVVDGGIDVTHPDLKDNIWENPTPDPEKNDKNGYNFVSSTGTIKAHNHGTHVAGTISARNGNGIGVCGVAGGDANKAGVKLMSCQIFEHHTDPKQTDLYALNIPDAIKYGAANGAVICQNSWELARGASLTTTMKTAIEYFIKYAGCDGETDNQRKDSRMKGGIVIFAAGNGNPTPTEDWINPNSYNSVVAVASISPNFKLASYSNRGIWVDISAPGGELTPFASRAVYSTLPGGKYGPMQGTSMACPHVSGVAALIVSKFGKQGFTADELKTKLLAAISPYNIYDYNPNFQRKMGNGLIDAVAALRTNEKIAPEKVTSIKTTREGENINFEWTTVSDKDDKYAFKYIFYYSSVTDLDNSNYKSGAKQEIITNRIPAGTTVNGSLNKIDKSKIYSFAVVAQDRWGNTSEPFFFKETSNYAPNIKMYGEDNFTVSSGKNVTIKFDINDPEGDTWEYKLEGYTQCVKDIRNDNVLSLEFSNNGEKGTHSVTLIVTDEKGASNSKVINFEILEANVPPTLISEINDIIVSVNGTSNIKLSDYFTDSANDKITYTAESNDNSVATALINEDVLSIKGLKAGNCSIKVNATDNANASVSTNVSVKVIAGDGSLVYAYPTSVETTFNVQLIDSRITSATLNIMTPIGSVVYKKEISSVKERNFVLNLSKLPRGSYILLVNTNIGTHSQRFIKL